MRETETNNDQRRAPCIDGPDTIVPRHLGDDGKGVTLPRSL